MQGDVACDPWYPDFIAWTCLDVASCSSVEVNLDNYTNISSIWTMVTAEEADIWRGEAPESEGSIECQLFADKFGSSDIGEGNDYWCDMGRVYECTEWAEYE